MNLERLHSPQPLRDADFAAIRARVRAEIAARRTSRNAWLLVWRIAFAAALVVLFVPRTTVDVPNVPVVWTAVAPAAALPAAPSQSGNSVAAVQKPKRKRRPQPKPESAITRIDFQTADPDIRIIWIVPANPKERS